jgi:hypothetical protein
VVSPSFSFNPEGLALFARSAARAEQTIAKADTTIAHADATIGQPSPHPDDLDATKARLDNITAQIEAERRRAERAAQASPENRSASQPAGRPAPQRRLDPNTGPHQAPGHRFAATRTG